MLDERRRERQRGNGLWRRTWNERLRAAGIDPSDAKVREISSVISKYFAERTAEVLQHVQEVLDKVSREELH
jgi:hypothetical protein